MSKEWREFQKPFYRIKLDTDSEQFKLLKALKENRPANVVLYSTPLFIDTPTFDSLYRRRLVVENSGLFALQDFPNHNSGYHHLVYTEADNYGMLFSKPTPIKKRTIRDFLEYTPDSMTLYDKARIIFSIISDAVQKPESSWDIEREDRIQFVNSIYSILWTRYNILWLPIVE